MAQKRITKSYDQEFKSQAVKLTQKIGGHCLKNDVGELEGILGKFRPCVRCGCGHILKCNSSLSMPPGYESIKM